MESVVYQANRIREYIKQLEDYAPLPGAVGFCEELFEHREPIENLELAVKDEPFFRRKSFDHISDLGLYRVICYVVARVLRPKNFVETGVLHGITSDFILTALRMNGEGHLWSIDLPSYFESGPSNKDGYNDTLPSGRQPGWTIAEKNLRHWDLLLGSSLDELPSLFSKLGEIDVFLHDSEHTYETMSAELNLAWPVLREGGVLMCDNIYSNDAFPEFCRKIGRVPLLFPSITETVTNGMIPITEHYSRFGLILK